VRVVEINRKSVESRKRKSVARNVRLKLKWYYERACLLRPSKESWGRFSKGKGKTVDKGKCSSMWFGFKNPGVCRGRVFRRGEMGGLQCRKRVFGLGAGPTFARFW
jgi:hypothetical protein